MGKRGVGTGGVFWLAGIAKEASTGASKYYGKY